MNSAWWLIAPLALLIVWWLAGRPGWPKPPQGPEQGHAGTVAPAVEAGGAHSTVALAPDEDETQQFEQTSLMPQAAEDEIRREQEQLAARQAAERASRDAAEQAAAEQEAALRAAYRAAEEAQARRVAEREAAEALARQQAADEHARRELQRQQQEAEEAEEQRRLAAVPPPAPSRLPEQTLVMVVDDSKVVRVKTSRLLAKHQYRVVLAEDCEQALLQIASDPPQVLITDVEMPGIDGIELTRRLRANASTAQLPIIMVTSADDRLREVADEVGVSVLLGKPYADEALIGSIEQLVGIAPASRLSPA